LRKEYRIRSRRDFVNVARFGFYCRTGTVVVQGISNGWNDFRVGFTASKRVGNAVVRNRCKRRLRSAADILLQDVGLAGVDYVFIAREATFSEKWDVLLDETKSAIMFVNRKVLKCRKQRSH
jgi:ribonuclease P protein component